MEVYIDFDRTLFDTDNFLNDLYNIIADNNIDLKIFKKYCIKENKHGFNVYNVLARIKNIDNIDNIIKKIDTLISNCNNYLYNDSYEFLNKLKVYGYKVNLLTKGNEEFQLKKVNSTKLINLFDNIIVTLKKKGELDINYEESIFIDDNPEEIKSILKRKPKKIFRIKRENSKYNDIKVNNINEVNNLLEINI